MLIIYFASRQPELQVQGNLYQELVSKRSKNTQKKYYTMQSSREPFFDQLVLIWFVFRRQLRKYALSISITPQTILSLLSVLCLKRFLLTQKTGRRTITTTENKQQQQNKQKTKQRRSNNNNSSTVISKSKLIISYLGLWQLRPWVIGNEVTGAC